MFKIFMKLRFILVTIFLAVSVLSFKVDDIVNYIELTLNSILVSEVHAQTPSQINLQKNGAQFPANVKLHGNPPLSVKVEASSPPDDPTLFSQSEIAELQKLANRRQVIEARNEELTLRSSLLTAAEKKINKKLLEIKSLEITLLKKLLNNKLTATEKKINKKLLEVKNLEITLLKKLLNNKIK
jgi:hypothetical protein